MIEVTCPRCKVTFSAFSPEWQAQKASKEKYCPSCKSRVVPEYALVPFLGWFAAFTSIGVAGSFFLGAYAFATCLVTGMLAALFFSLRLRRES